MKEVKLTSYVTLLFKTGGGHSDWFGYYNYDTLNHDQTKMLCNRAPKDGVAPEKGDVIELGYYDIPSGEWYPIGCSDSWNWQQGAMMQWLKLYAHRQFYVKLADKYSVKDIVKEKLGTDKYLVPCLGV